MKLYLMASQFILRQGRCLGTVTLYSVPPRTWFIPGKPVPDRSFLGTPSATGMVKKCNMEVEKFRSSNCHVSINPLTDMTWYVIDVECAYCFRNVDVFIDEVFVWIGYERSFQIYFGFGNNIVIVDIVWLYYYCTIFFTFSFVMTVFRIHTKIFNSKYILQTLDPLIYFQSIPISLFTQKFHFWIFYFHYYTKIKIVVLIRIQEMSKKNDMTSPYNTEKINNYIGIQQSNNFQ